MRYCESTISHSCSNNSIVSFSSFQTPSAVIERLLNHFRWDVERLVENYYREGKDNFFTAAHIVYPFAKAALPATDVDYCPVSFVAY